VRHFLPLFFFTWLLIASGAHLASAQQEVQDNIDNASTYLDHRISSLEKSLDITGKLQQKLLKRLQRKEDKMLRQLEKQDSALYKQYVQQHLSYDSIAVISSDSARHQQLIGNSKAIDSLKGIQHFIQDQSNKLSGSAGMLNKAGVSMPGSIDLASIQQKINAQANIDQLIQQHTNELKQLAGNTNISGLQNIQKDLYYARAKIKAYEEMADDPDKTEAEALEYLQGTEGFDKYLNTNNNNTFGGLGNNATEADLLQAGFQTKNSVSNALQNKLGNNLSSVQQQMSQQIQQYSEKLNDLKQKADALKAKADEAKQTLNDAKDAKNSITNIDKPDFKVNKEKGKPFLQRIEWNYNFQTSRASTDGLKPAMLNLGLNIGYKQTERLSFGIGAALNTGLGQNWQHLRLSYEGISLRAYADWLWIYGFSIQTGYERAFIPANRPYLVTNTDANNNSNSTTQSSENALQQAFGGGQQTAYIGIMKRYKVSSKWNGTFLVGYNFLWNEAGQRSPFILRFGWSK